jgi:hypothetical protein
VDENDDEMYDEEEEDEEEENEENEDVWIHRKSWYKHVHIFIFNVNSL